MTGRPAQALGAVIVILGIAILVRTLAEGGGAGAIGVVLGVLFVAAGAGRVWLARTRQ